MRFSSHDLRVLERPAKRGWNYVTLGRLAKVVENNDEIGSIHRLSVECWIVSFVDCSGVGLCVVVAEAEFGQSRECFGSLPDDWAEAAAMTRSAVSHLAAASVSVVSTVEYGRTPARLFLSWVPERLVLGWLGASFKGFFIRSKDCWPACQLQAWEEPRLLNSQFAFADSELWPNLRSSASKLDKTTKFTIPMRMRGASATLYLSSLLT